MRTRRLRSLAVAGLALENFVTYFVDQRTGAFSSRTEAGNIGYDVLSQFTITLDYRHLVAYAEALAVARLPVYDRAGLVIEREAGRLIVDEVRPDSPAANAGIVLNDVLVGVNGREGAKVSAQSFRGLTRAASGSVLMLNLQHQGHVRRLDLRLRELLCTSAAAHCSPAVRHIATPRPLTQHNGASW